MSFFCRSTLAPIDERGFAPAASRKLAGGNRRFPHRLSFTRADLMAFRSEQADHFSISGVQDKVPLRLRRGRLEPVVEGGLFMLKPIPSSPLPRFQADVPANEHVTMQIADQVFGIQCALNACMELADGEPAYLTRRFDRLPDGVRIPQEDFCQLSNRSEETAGKNYKYDATIEETGRLLKQYCGAYRVEIEKLYVRHLFNYVISNGDAHLKNLSLHRTSFGDYVLTPAYDLLCTSLHFPHESRTALDLFDDDETDSFKENGFYKRADFLLLAEKYGIDPAVAVRMLDRLSDRRPDVAALVSRSFMSPAAKEDYMRRYDDRLRAVLD
jgi:serine/threonine-protein kinase HipA